ncbi:MAG: SDR family oxidoreductase [Planctomycetota bacterium]
MGVDLTNRVIVITGGGTGIGRATALACARAGMHVALGARRLKKLQAVADEVRALGTNAIAVECDVGRAEDSITLLDRADAELGPVYAAFANAGYGFESRLLDTPDERIAEIMDTNFYGSMRLARPAIERMRSRGEGHFLFCSSCLSKLGVPYYAPYCMSKAAQDFAARSLRHELEPEGIAVTSIHPVGTRTDFFDTARANSGGQTLADRTPSAMLQPPEAVAKRIVRKLRAGKGGEVWTGFTKRFPFAISVMFPGLTDLLLRRMVAKRR